MNWNKSGYDKFSTQQRIFMNQREENERIRKKESEKIREYEAKKVLDRITDESIQNELSIQNKIEVLVSDTECYEIIQYENKTIHVFVNGSYVGDRNNKKHLKIIAEQMNVNIYNGNDNLKNTRTLGKDIIVKAK